MSSTFFLSKSCCASLCVDTFQFLRKHSAPSFGHWDTFFFPPCTHLAWDEKLWLGGLKLRLLWKPTTLWPAPTKDWKLEILLARVSAAASLADLVTCIDAHLCVFFGGLWGPDISLRPGYFFETRIFLWVLDISLRLEYFFGRWLEVLAGEAALLLELILLAHLVSLDQAAKLWRVLVVRGH